MVTSDAIVPRALPFRCFDFLSSELALRRSVDVGGHRSRLATATVLQELEIRLVI